MSIIKVAAHMRKGKRVRSFTRNVALRSRLMKALGKQGDISQARYGHRTFRTQRNLDLRRRLSVVEGRVNAQFKEQQVASWVGGGKKRRKR